jgi:hypothetical protein
MRERFCDYLIDSDVGFFESTKDIGKCCERIFFEVFVCLDREVFIICFFDAGSTNNGMITSEADIFWFITDDDLCIGVYGSNALRNGMKEVSISDEKEIGLPILVDNLVGNLYMVEYEIHHSKPEWCRRYLPNGIMNEVHDTYLFFEIFLSLVFFIEFWIWTG